MLLLKKTDVTLLLSYFYPSLAAAGLVVPTTPLIDRAKNETHWIRPRQPSGKHEAAFGSAMWDHSKADVDKIVTAFTMSGKK